MVNDDLKSILPDVKSFSPTNLKYMRYFYEMYPDAVICPQVEDELITDANRPQAGDDLQIIFRIPWGHNKIILDKCKGNSEACFGGRERNRMRTMSRAGGYVGDHLKGIAMLL